MVPQDQTVATVNQMADVVKTFVGLLSSIAKITNAYSQMSMGPICEALPTCKLNADGSLGTQDAQPVAGNPININVISKLHFAMTSYEIGVMYNFLQSVTALGNGAAVAAQPATPAVLAKVMDDEI